MLHKAIFYYYAIISDPIFSCFRFLCFFLALGGLQFILRSECPTDSHHAELRDTSEYILPLLSLPLLSRKVLLLAQPVRS